MHEQAITLFIMNKATLELTHLHSEGRVGLTGARGADEARARASSVHVWCGSLEDETLSHSVGGGAEEALCWTMRPEDASRNAEGGLGSRPPESGVGSEVTLRSHVQCPRFDTDI